MGVIFTYIYIIQLIFLNIVYSILYEGWIPQPTISKANFTAFGVEFQHGNPFQLLTDAFWILLSRAATATSSGFWQRGQAKCWPVARITRTGAGAMHKIMFKRIIIFILYIYRCRHYHYLKLLVSRYCSCFGTVFDWVNSSSSWKQKGKLAQSGMDKLACGKPKV
jgi:hypothetical protein